MKYKIGDIVTTKYYPGEVATITSSTYSSWSNKYTYWVVFHQFRHCNYFEEDLELATPEAPAQAYLDLFM